MTYQEIKSFINTYIVQNGVNAITGAQLNTILNGLADYKGFDSVVVTTLPAGSDATGTVQGMTLVLGIPKGADGRDGKDAVNPFKGLLTSTDELPDNPHVGDYAYVLNTSPAGTASIYVCATAGTWTDSTEDVDLNNSGSGEGLTAEERAAIVALFEMAVYTGDGAEEYIDILRNPPVPKTLASIAVTVQSPQPPIYDNQTLDDVKNIITVTATYSDNTTSVIASADYSLVGDISTTGTKTLVASYTEDGVTKTANFNVTVTAAPVSYSVTNTLTNCMTSNNTASCYGGTAYNATISPSSGYTLNGATVQVTMGGEDITSTAYDNGVISIANVTGNITITITAAALVLTGITASFNPPSGTSFYADDSTDSLKQYLIVTALYSNGPSEEIGSNDYTLSPATLSAPSTTVTVSYQGFTDTFTVTVRASEWDVDLDESDFVIGRSSSPNHNGGDYPYTQSNAGRAIYPWFDLPISGGKTYEIHVSGNPSIVCGIAFYTDAALVKQQTQQQMTINTDFYDTGWLTNLVNGVGTINVPQKPNNAPSDASIVCGRPVIKIADGSNVPNDVVISVKLKEVQNG